MASDPPVYEPLGIALQSSYALEVTVTHTLSTALGVSLGTASLIGGNAGMGRSMGIIRDLVDRGESKAEIDGLAEWLPELKAAIEARNRLVHRPWMGDTDADGYPQYSMTKTFDLVPRSKADVDADIRVIWVAIKSCPAMAWDAIERPREGPPEG